MTKAAHCEAKLHAFRRTQDGVVVSFVIHPQEVPPALALDPLGTRYMLALAEIGDDEKPVEKATAPAEPEKPKRRFQDLPRSQQAGMMCQDQRFVAWLSDAYPDTWTRHGGGDAAATVRALCGVTSRGHFDTNPRAAGEWDQLLTIYYTATGRMARDPRDTAA